MTKIAAVEVENCYFCPKVHEETDFVRVNASTTGFKNRYYCTLEKLSTVKVEKLREKKEEPLCWFEEYKRIYQPSKTPTWCRLEDKETSDEKV